MSRIWVLAVALTAATAAGCGYKCGAGTRVESGVCVPDPSLDASQPGKDSGAPDAAALAGPDASADAGERAGLDAGPDGGSNGPDANVPFIPCQTAFECPPLLACRAGQCAIPPDHCNRDRDCPNGQICDTGACVLDCQGINGFCPTGLVCRDGRCVNPPAKCTRDQDCPGIGGTNTCGSDGACVASCNTSCACAAGDVCRSSLCVPQPATCIFDDDCSCDAFVFHNQCVGGGCGALCKTSCDCNSGRICVSGRCAQPPSICGSDADCPCGDGPQQCVWGACRKPCKTSCDCAPANLSDASACIGNFCQIAPATCTTEKDCPCENGHQASCDHGQCTFGACQIACDCPSGFACTGSTCGQEVSGFCNTGADCACNRPCGSAQGYQYCGCATNYDCPVNSSSQPDKVCDLTTRSCVAPPKTCQGPADCPGARGQAANICSSGTCVACDTEYAYCTSDAMCSPCPDGSPQICHVIGNGLCAPRCNTSLDCYSTFTRGGCQNGRCTDSSPHAPCKITADCSGAELSIRNVFYYPECQGGFCVPPSCKDSGDCAPLTPPGSPADPFICKASHCVPAPKSCVTADDCPWPTGLPTYSCVAPGVCQ